MAVTDALLLVLRDEMPLHLPFCCLGTNRQRPFHAQRPRVRSLHTTTHPQTLLRTTPFFQTSLGFPVLKPVPALEQSILETGSPILLEKQFKKYYALHFVSDNRALVPCLVFLHHQPAFGAGACHPPDDCSTARLGPFRSFRFYWEPIPDP